MIRQLTLKNWRSYENAIVPFGPGTTFVIATNGVGKTSLVEAARWALFGKIARGGHTAIRAGTEAATAIIELELHDKRVLSVERTLTRKPRSVPPVIHLDGTPLTEEQLHQLLSNVYRTEPTFLAALTMPAIDRDTDKPTALGLEEHLGGYYGIDGLRKAIDQLKAMHKANGARIKRTKSSNSATAQRLSQLQNELREATQRVKLATETHKAAQDRIDKAQERERFEREHQAWQDRMSSRDETVKRLSAQIATKLGITASANKPQEALELRLRDLNKEIEKIHVDIAVNDSKTKTLTANQDRLDSAHEDCPVCRRPLDDATIATAHEANMREASAIRDMTLELKTTEKKLLGQREALETFLADYRRIPDPGQAPPQSAAANDEIAIVAELAPMVENALNMVVEARADHARAAEALKEAQAADKAMRELELLFKNEAALTVAIEATEATLAELLNDTIHPLAAEVNQRWQKLFPNRGRLNTSADGTITRTVNGHPLAYESFSTGESMGTTILLKLLVAQMATAADFCWFDEPLEHLDPDVRRKVANLLSRATSGEGQLRQVVVTTYEEPLARKLKARDKQRVTLVDVRQET